MINAVTANWEVQPWFVIVCSGIALTWIVLVSSISVWNHSQLRIGERNTAAEGRSRDIRLRHLEQREILPEMFEAKVNSHADKIDRLSQQFVRLRAEMDVHMSHELLDPLIRTQENEE